MRGARDSTDPPDGLLQKELGRIHVDESLLRKEELLFPPGYCNQTHDPPARSVEGPILLRVRVRESEILKELKPFEDVVY